MSENSGIINAYNNTEAKGYGSVIAYAKDDGLVNITGTITATDAWASTDTATAPYLYTNIGALAISSGTLGAVINISGNATINGIGALASGNGAIINLDGTGNIINNGVNGGLVALNSGEINFAGGTITHKAISSGSHDGKIPFYADSSTGSSITFTGPTTIEMYNGAVFSGSISDYAASASGTTAYNGMGNVTINLQNNGINIGSFSNVAVTWNPSLGLYSIVNSLTGVGAINDNGYDWIISYTDGTFNIGSSTDYNTDKLKNVVLEKEIVNIAVGATLVSTLGNSLMVTSNDSASTNASSIINNYGTINVTGGSAATAAFGAYVNFGQINNEGLINVDIGAGIYGENGSKLINNTTGIITITGSGVGIAARATRAIGGPNDYGTDIGDGTYLIEIENKGTIATGDDSIGIYADNNSGLLNTRNLALITSNKAIIVGDDSVGVMMEGAVDGGTVELTSTGGTDITVGENGIAIYGENSDIRLYGSSFNISVGSNGIGIMTEGDSDLLLGTLKLNYIGSLAEDAIGIVYKGVTGKVLTNGINVEVTTPVGMTGNATGLYLYGGGTVSNSGNITATAGGAYGIITDGVDITNTGIITTGTSGNTGGIGIYSQDASVITTGEKLKVYGTEAVGIYAVNNGLTLSKTIEINHGTNNLEVAGKEAVGIYIEDNYSNSQLILDNNDNIDLVASTNDTDTRVGIYLKNAQNTSNDTSGLINVTGTTTTGYNVGIYTKDSYLNQSGTVAISGVSNVGIFAESTGSNTNTLNLTNTSNINVNTATMNDVDINVGVYGEGNNVIINSSNSHFSIAANAKGIYLNGGSQTMLNGIFNFDLQSDASGKLGIGSYFKGGSYANSSSTIKVSSLSTATDITGEFIRPIGLYYGSGSTKNEADIEIVAGSQDIIGMYTLSLANFIDNGNIIINARGIGAYYSNSNIINSGAVHVNTTSSYGLFFIGGNSSSTGIINVNSTDSFGVISKGSGTIYDNQGTIETRTASSTGAAAVDQGYIKNSGNIDIYAGYGVMAMDNGSEVELVGGSIIEEKLATTITYIGASAVNGGKITLNDGNIAMLDKSIGIYLSQGKAELKLGDIKVGSGGIGIYAVNNSNINMTNYSGEIKIGDSGVAIYSKDSTLGTAGSVGIEYSGYTNKGVGIYYASAVSGTAVTNAVSVNHIGDNLVSIYADAVSLINTATQVIKEKGIGIYSNNADIKNNGILSIEGDNSIGIYLDGNSTLSMIGTIEDNTPKTSISDYKIGVYVNSGDITGNSVYNFGVDGGIGVYLANNIISYTGTINVKGNGIQHTLTDLARPIGLYVGSTVSGSIDANINVTGTEAIGLYLEERLGVGANITYNGDIIITSLNTTEKGVGAYLSSNTTLTLGPTGSMTIGGTENIGFYVDSGATLNISGGTVTNTADGIFAYIKNGSIVFSAGSSPNINYANVIVSGPTGNLNNSTTITVGTSGLQATDGGTAHNTTTGVINSTVQSGMAMAGEGSATILINDGSIVLTGDNSVGIYSKSNAQATSTGNVEVGKGGVAYYADLNGIINVSGTTKVDQNGAMFYSSGGTINYTGVDIVGAKETTIAIVTDSASVIDFNNKELAVGEGGTGVIVEGSATANNVQNIGKLTVGKDATGIYLDIINNSIVNNNITLGDINAIGILLTNSGDINYIGTISSIVLGAKGII